MRQFFEPFDAPFWLKRFSASVRDALSDVWNTAIRLKDYATADLPPAADWKQGLVYDSTLNAPHYSNGTNWIRLSDYDADIAAIAALSTTGIIVRTGAGTAATRTITGTANQISVANGDGVAANPTLSLPSAITAPGSLAVTTSLSCDGSATLGNANTDTHTVNGSLTVEQQFLPLLLKSTDNNAGKIDLYHQGSRAGMIAANASYYFSVLDTTATSVLTMSSTGLAVTGAISATTSFSCDGSATLGNVNTDTHTVNGTLTVEQQFLPLLLKSTDNNAGKIDFYHQGSRSGLIGSNASLCFVVYSSGVSERFAIDNTTGAVSINGTQVLTARKTGWSAATGTATRSTFDTATVTTAQLAERVKALMDDLISHGTIGT